ncbi:MAG: AAA family ATPase [Candidatus Bathyarchaeum sp.]|nr:MAG: AAA family ATPase [Candidatus Bathyarchaeum sp.]
MNPTQVSYPGVYIEEVPSGVRAISGVSTSIAVFIGLANCRNDQVSKTAYTPQPKRLFSYPQYEQEFGPPHPQSDLATSVRLFFLNGGTKCYAINICESSAADTTLPSEDDVVDLYTEGIKSLDSIDIFNLLIITKLDSDTRKDGDNDIKVGMSDTKYLSILNEASKYCKKRRAFLLIDPLDRWTTWQDPIKKSELSELRNNVETENSAIYFPRLELTEYDHVQKKRVPKKIGPAAAIAGIIAEVDSQYGVWKAPAGVNTILEGIKGVDIPLNDMQNGLLNLQAINCIRQFQTGTVCWGARTVAGYTDGDWKYIPIRRLALYIEETLYRGTKWVVFEPNDETTWAAIRANVRAFMMNLFIQGAFQGTSPKEAFFVKCDGDTTTEYHRKIGIVNIIVGFAPLKPAEFVILQIQQRIPTLKITPRYTWEDLVLPDGKKKQLREICVRADSRVYDVGGVEKHSLRKGLKFMFSGPSGTGKTMAAEVMANELRLDLFRIDLSMVVSKYIGETEKNLNRIFNDAEESNVILFFDEADALFGKRSEVRDADDRYKNEAINYLLNKMEEYEGIVILAINLRKYVDEAFLRRMHFIVEFPFPKEEYRREIWKKVFKEKAPLNDVDFISLSKLKVSGGDIKRIALTAAFLAARNSDKITLKYIVKAAKRETQ